jgi:hypothetical protein
VDELAGLEALEGLVLMRVKGTREFEEELEEFIRRVRLHEWPHLCTVKIRRDSQDPWWEHTGKEWDDLRLILERMGFRPVAGIANERIIGVVVAGVSFSAIQDSVSYHAIQNSDRTWRKQRAFADGQGYRHMDIKDSGSFSFSSS